MSTPSNPHGIVPGQRLYFVPSDKRRAGFWFTVGTVGRKWITPSDHYGMKLDVKNLRSHEWPHGLAWVSKEAADEHAALCAAWLGLRLDLDRRFTPPDGLTLEAVAKVRSLLLL